MTIRSIVVRKCGYTCCTAARSLRLTRLRTTAPPSFLPVATDTLARSIGLAVRVWAMMINIGCDQLRPFWRTRSNSPCGRRRNTRAMLATQKPGFSLKPGFLLSRLSNRCASLDWVDRLKNGGLSNGELAILCGHPWSSCARESHTFAPCVVFWVEMCAWAFYSFEISPIQNDVRSNCTGRGNALVTSEWGL